jgi:hypothetical protein
MNELMLWFFGVIFLSVGIGLHASPAAGFITAGLILLVTAAVLSVYSDINYLP